MKKTVFAAMALLVILFCGEAHAVDYQFISYATKDDSLDIWQRFEFDITHLISGSSSSTLSFDLIQDMGSGAETTTSSVLFGIENGKYYVHLDYHSGNDSSHWKEVMLDIDGQRYVDQYYGLGIIGETSQAGNWGRHDIYGNTDYDATTYIMSEIPDTDNDGIPEYEDNCPNIPNFDQLDEDSDGVGDVCDYKYWKSKYEDCAIDGDGDGIMDYEDNCPEIPNTNQSDVDIDGTGDVCDNDTIYGYTQPGVVISLDLYSCGTSNIENTTTSSEGYYAFGNLEDEKYGVVPNSSEYTFNPQFKTVDIPQTVIQPYNFIATMK